MTTRTTGLGGTDWGTEILYGAADLVDTFDAVYSKILELEKSIPPIGSIIPWAKTLGTDSIPYGWILCDGEAISDTDSILNGQNTPALNGNSDATSKFIATATTSGGTGGASTHEHDLDNSDGGSTYTDNSAPRSYTAGTGVVVPPYYEVNFIMRYK